MIRLYRYLGSCPMAVEADLHRYYQVDLVDLFRRGTALTMRKAVALVSSLPPDSAVATWERGGPMWTPEADILDQIRTSYLQVHSKADAPLPEPHPASPLARRRAEQRMSREEEWAAWEAREAARQERLAARRAELEGGDDE